MTKVTRNTTDTNGIAQEFTFGVEIETTCPRNNRLRIGSYYSTGEQVPYLPEGWVAKRESRDGSFYGVVVRALSMMYCSRTALPF